MEEVVNGEGGWRRRVGVARETGGCSRGQLVRASGALNRDEWIRRVIVPSVAVAVGNAQRDAGGCGNVLGAGDGKVRVVV